MEYASKGVAGAGLGLGIAGTALGLLNGGLGNLLGGGCGTAWNNNCGCSENNLVNRYELGLTQELAAREQEIALLKADKYTDQKIVEVTTYFNNKIDNINAQLGQQAVYNATLNGTVSCMAGQIAQLQGLTKLIVPITSVCPQPMPEFNSWTAPTAAAPTNVNLTE